MKKVSIVMVVLVLASVTSQCPKVTAHSNNKVYVDDDKPDGTPDGSWENPFTTIMDGIRAVKEEDEKDTVCVLSGTYREHIMIKESLNLESKDGAIIEGGWIIITAEDKINVNISGFTMQNSSEGIWLQHKAHATISGFIIDNNTFWGIRLTGEASATIKDSIITGNGNGIQMGGGASATITGSTLTGNHANFYLWGEAQVTITGSTTMSGAEGVEIGIVLGEKARATITGSTTISGNKVGIMLLSETHATITNSTISGNTEKGISLSGGATTTITNSTISANVNEGVVLTDEAHATITSSTTISGNKVGINMKVNASATIVKCIISANEIGIGGEAKSNATVDECTIIKNRNEFKYKSENTIHYGVHLSGEATAAIKNCTINENDIGVYLEGSATATINCCTIAGNKEFGVQNVTGEEIDATYNYWGHESGPSGPSANGEGDRVSSHVTFFPWREQPPTPFMRGVYSVFDLQHDTVDLYVRVVDENYSGMIYDIEILLEDQMLPWDFVDGIKAPPGWSFEEIDDGLRFFTETDPLLTCHLTRFRFRVQGERIPLYMRVHVTDSEGRNMGILISVMRWLYYNTYML